MKLSKNLQLEIKLHTIWLRSLVPAAVFAVLFYNLPIFDEWPVWAKFAMPLLCAVLHYLWWRQCLSPDKKTFTPRIWK